MENNTIKLWHGGRNLEYNFKTFKTPAKGKWEYGPGLYLTNNYHRAYNYAKGGGSTYLIEIEKGNDLKNISIPLTDAFDFLQKNILKSKLKNIYEDLNNNSHRMKTYPNVQLEILLNLIINYEAIQSKNIEKLNKFLVENGADYSIVNNYGGNGETVFVILNKEKIKKVNKIKAQDVKSEMFELSVDFSHTKTNKKSP